MIRGYSDKARAVFDRYIDVSDVNIFIFCPYKLYLTKYIGLKSKDTFKSILGKILHRVYLYTSHLLAENIDIDSARKRVLEDVSKRFNIDIGDVKKHIDRVIEYRYSIPLLSRDVRIEFHVKSDKLCLKGYIDLIEGSYPIEVKLRDEVRYSDVIQLTLYTLLLEDMYRSDIDYGYIDLIGKGVRRKIYINSDVRAKALKYRERVQVAEMTGIYPRFKGSCNKCDIKNECRLMFS